MSKEEKPEETKEENKHLAIVANGRGLVLRSMDDMWRFACAVRDSGMAPSSFTKPEQILIALQSGAELGMPPMRSLQSFCVINGAARLWGDAPLALVRQSGLLEYIKEDIEGEGNNMVAVCETKRKGDPEPKITQFSMKDATVAGLLAKKGGVWRQYPKRMLMYRARSFNLRDNFPDCFGGSTIAEEYEGIETLEPSRETPEKKPTKKDEQNEIVDKAFFEFETANQAYLNDNPGVKFDLDRFVAAIIKHKGRLPLPKDKNPIEKILATVKPEEVAVEVRNDLDDFPRDCQEGAEE